MRKWASIIMLLVILAVFSFGCAGVEKDAKVKCPKCGAVFTVDEALDSYWKKQESCKNFLKILVGQANTLRKKINYPLEERVRNEKGRDWLFLFF